MPVGRTKSFDKIGLVHRHLTHNRRANSVPAATKVFCSMPAKDGEHKFQSVIQPNTLFFL